MIVTADPSPEIERWEPDSQDYFMLRELIHTARAEALEANPDMQYSPRYVAALLGQILDASGFRPVVVRTEMQP